MEEPKTRALLERISKLEENLKDLTDALRHKNRALEIEFAMEKVRANAIHASGSEKLSDASAVLFQVVNELGISTDSISIGIFDDPIDATELWITTISSDQKVIQILEYFSLHIHPVFENIISARQQRKPHTVTVLRGNQIRDYYLTTSPYGLQGENQAKTFPPEEFFNTFFFSHGTVNVNTRKSLTNEELSILMKVTSTFGLVYPHFLNLAKAEAQTREIQRQQSLDEVRAEIASMRTIRDLDKITPLIWKGLVGLNIEFLRCGVFIVNEKEQVVHAYLSTANGNSLGVINLPFEDLDTTKKIVKNWKEGKTFQEHWNRQQFESWVQAIVKMRPTIDIEEFVGSGVPIESLRLEFTPFAQGMLYVGSREFTAVDQIDLVKSLADSFSVAYARYEDFTQLDHAKKSIEATLLELKATQSQLIQSEKMASLGELTAGIAHEIQNPLNFVNNFSEINNELLVEMDAAILRGDYDEVRTIAKHVSDNHERINYHGNRAGSIVKSMLQHSRTNVGQKELTDINVLCDEYVRLAHHGYRAKEKSFSAKFETDFDATLDKINIIPQDIARVVLNLINNAFYAVSQKSELNINHYEPTVTVTTKKQGEKVLIFIKDNGLGIPQNTIDKIFQPFFTTKPSGQGTGLGLSLSYDIVKAHGGELKVTTEDGIGTEFVINLPNV